MLGSTADCSDAPPPSSGHDLYWAKALLSYFKNLRDARGDGVRPLCLVSGCSGLWSEGKAAQARCLRSAAFDSHLGAIARPIYLLISVLHIIWTFVARPHLHYVALSSSAIPILVSPFVTSIHVLHCLISIWIPECNFRLSVFYRLFNIKLNRAKPSKNKYF